MIALALAVSLLSPPAIGQPCVIETWRPSPVVADETTIYGLLVGTSGDAVRIIWHGTVAELDRTDITRFEASTGEHILAIDYTFLPKAIEDFNSTAWQKAAADKWNATSQEWEREAAEADAREAAVVKPKPSAEIQTRYDKFEDQTSLYVGAVSLEDCPIAIAAAVISKGKNERAPVAAALFFTRSGEDWEYLKSSREAIFLVDGKRTRIAISHDGDVFMGGVSETMTGIISHAMLKQLFTGTKIEFKVGSSECVVDDAARDAFRALVKRTTPK